MDKHPLHVEIARRDYRGCRLVDQFLMPRYLLRGLIPDSLDANQIGARSGATEEHSSSSIADSSDGLAQIDLGYFVCVDPNKASNHGVGVGGGEVVEKELGAAYTLTVG